MKIGICNDHAGVDYKNQLMEYLKGKGYEMVNFGTDTTASMDYPDVAHPLAEAVESGSLDPKELITLPYEEAFKKLTALKGVGPKVANCVLLFGLRHTEAFPVDVWIKKCLKNISTPILTRVYSATEQELPSNIFFTTNGSQTIKFARPPFCTF